MALAVEIAAFNFPNVLSVLVNNAGINPNEPYVIGDLKTGLLIRTNALTHLITQWGDSDPRLKNVVLRFCIHC